MKILLIGEYSRFHNSLKEGLETLGHKVTLVGTGDAFKKYPVDLAIAPTYTTSTWLATKIRRAIYKITSYDIALWETGYRFKKIRHKLKGYDVVQLINSWSIRTTVNKEKQHLTYLAKHNGKIFLSACGTDTPWVETLLQDEELPYHLLTRYLLDPSTANYYLPALKYTSAAHKSLYTLAESLSQKVIPTDMDYFLSLRKNKKATSLVPTPIHLSRLRFDPKPIADKIVIFHGINRDNYYNKGNDIFEKALAIISKTYAKKIEIITVESLPYKDYMKAYASAHILLDQVYSHDQGYNALEAMARGKVVFTGAGKHFMEHYQLAHPVAIDATPDPKDVARKLENLILNPNQILEIAQNARKFVEAHHDHIKIAKTYLEIWNE